MLGADVRHRQARLVQLDEPAGPGDPRRVDGELPPAAALATIGDGPDDVAIAGIVLVGCDPRRALHDASAPSLSARPFRSPRAVASSSEARAGATRPRTRT